MANAKRQKSTYDDLYGRSASSMSKEAMVAQQPFLVRGSFASLAREGVGPFGKVPQLDVRVLQDFYKKVLLPRLAQVAITYETSTELTTRPCVKALIEALRIMCIGTMQVGAIPETSPASEPSSSATSPAVQGHQYRSSDSSTEDMCATHENTVVTGPRNNSSVDVTLQRRVKAEPDLWAVKAVLEAKTNMHDAGKADWGNTGQYQLLKYVIQCYNYNRRMAGYEGMVQGFGTDLSYFHLGTVRVTGRVLIGEDGCAQECDGYKTPSAEAMQAALHKVRQLEGCEQVTQLRQGEYLLGEYYLTKQAYEFLPRNLPLPPKKIFPQNVNLTIDGLYGLGFLLRVCVGNALDKWVPGDEGTVDEKLKAWEDRVEQMKAACKPEVSIEDWKEAMPIFFA